MEERLGEAGFTMLLEPPNEAPGAGKRSRSRVKAVLDGSRFEFRVKYQILEQKLAHVLAGERTRQYNVSARLRLQITSESA